MIILYVLGITIVIVALACIVPFAQYLYAHFVQHEPYSLRYYFSEELFSQHMIHDLGLDTVRVINNRDEMQKLWEQELKHKLP